MLKQIKNLNILIDGRYGKVTDENDSIKFEGEIAKDMTHEDVYKAVTARREFRLKSNNKLLTSYEVITTFPGERESVIENLCYENNCTKDDIEDSLVYEEI